jgi:C-terminal processing protease CtpA/Prc
MIGFQFILIPSLRGMIHIQIILHLKKRTFDVSISGKLEGIGARLQRKMTLPKYLNLFQEVRRSGKQLEAGDLIMKAQGNGVPVDVVGMRLDDVVKKKLRGQRY